MKNTLVFVSGLLMLFFLNGCIDFGEDIETDKPKKSQIRRCISEMHLNPSINMTPLGFKFEGSGIDDAILFKFETETLDLSQVFNTTVVDVTKFKENFPLLPHRKGLKWWDVKGKNLFGGQISLPKERYMNVGMEKTESGFIIWHET